MITFIHTADIHFGMENYGRIDPATGIHTRLLDFVKALNFCIDVAIEKKVDFFLFSGDAYKTAHPSQTQQRLLIQCFLRLYDHKIPVVIIVGNHDHPLSFGKAHALEIFGEFPLDGFHVISKPKTVQLQTKNGPINIVGIPWPTRNMISLSGAHLDTSSSKITEYISQAVTHIIKDQASKLDPTLPAVLAGHLTVSSGIFSGSEKRAVFGTDPIFLPSQLAIAPFDYVALGHLHRHQDLNKNGIPVVYSGSIERIDFGERKEAKGFVLVNIHPSTLRQNSGSGRTDKRTTYEFIKTPIRPFIQIEVTIQENSPQTEQVLQEITKHDITDAIVKIIYHIPAGKKDNVDLKKIQRACQHAMYLVAIIPIHTTQQRTRRIGTMHVGMDIRSLMEKYFESKGDHNKRNPLLIDKAIELMEIEENLDS